MRKAAQPSVKRLPPPEEGRSVSFRKISNGYIESRTDKKFNTIETYHPDMPAVVVQKGKTNGKK